MPKGKTTEECLEIQINDDFFIQGDVRSFVLKRVKSVSQTTGDLIFEYTYYPTLELLFKRMIELGLANTECFNAIEMKQYLDEIHSDIKKTIESSKFNKFMKEIGKQRLIFDVKERSEKSKASRELIAKIFPESLPEIEKEKPETTNDEPKKRRGRKPKEKKFVWAVEEE